MRRRKARYQRYVARAWMYASGPFPSESVELAHCYAEVAGESFEQRLGAVPVEDLVEVLFGELDPFDVGDGGSGDFPLPKQKRELHDIEKIDHLERPVSRTSRHRHRPECRVERLTRFVIGGRYCKR